MGIDDVRKRTLISIIITFVCITLTNRLWFSINPLQISFNAEGAGNTKFEVFLNKKDNNDFKKVKYGVVEKNLDETDFVELFINRVHGAKRVKLSIQPPNPSKTLTISGFQLRYGKYKLDDLKAFSADGATLKIDGDKLIIYPQKDTFSIIYNNPVNIKSPTKFDIKVLIVIAVLSFLLAYKLTSYLADFKSLNNASRMDIIFLLIFFVILFIPMSNIDTKTEKSEKENRMLANFKPFIYKNKINFSFGNDFDNWFNDRFYLRKFILKSYSDIKYAIAQNYYYPQKGLIDKKHKMLFNLWYKGMNEKIIKRNFPYLETLNEFCRNNNIKLYILIVPEKEFIYNIPIDESSKNYNNIDLFKYINQYSDIKISYPLRELQQKSKENLVYFKTEHHWTDDGAFVGYRSLMQNIKKDYPNIEILTSEDFNYFYNKKVRGDFDREFGFGQTCKYVGISNNRCKKYLDTDYRYYRHKDFKRLSVKIHNKPLKFGKDYFYPNGADLKVVLLGTSMSENLCEFIPFTFKHVKRIRNNNVIGVKAGNEFKIMKYYKNEILNYKPDILIFCITYGNIHRLHQIFNKE